MKNVSVIIVTLNAAKNIEQSVGGIYQQKGDWKKIVPYLRITDYDSSN